VGRSGRHSDSEDTVSRGEQFAEIFVALIWEGLQGVGARRQLENTPILDLAVGAVLMTVTPISLSALLMTRRS
jgi:hypothetical protein